MQELYIVSEGKKHGATREVRPEAAFDKYYTVTRVHAGDAILNDNWHTNEVFSHARNNFEGYTFAMRTLEAWGAHGPERPPRLLHRGRPRLGFGSGAVRGQEAAIARQLRHEVAFVCGASC